MMQNPSPTLPASFDMWWILANVHYFLNPSRENFLLGYHVSKVQDGIAYISFAMPEDMIKAFILVHEGMALMLKNVQGNARTGAATNRVVSIDETVRIQKARDDYDKKVCSVFDKYISALPQNLWVHSCRGLIPLHSDCQAVIIGN